MWKLIHLNGNPTNYYINDVGEIKDDKNKPVRKFLKQDVLNDDVIKYFCNLKVGLKPCTLAVDTLVAHSFYKKKRGCSKVIHLDKNVLNNNVENLRLSSFSRNDFA